MIYPRFKEEKISKKMAAERQLKEAITLFFEQRDSVAIHTLASASYEILGRFTKDKEIDSFLRNRNNANNEKEWDLYKKWLNRWKNFFKHGNQNKDPKAEIEFPPKINVFIIHDCVHLYHKLMKDTFWEAEVWLRWVGLKYPDLIKDGPFRTSVIEEIPPSVDPDDFECFSDYLKEGIRNGM